MVEIDDEAQTEQLRFVNITSIVPNWVEFGFKALQLAKIWWTTANRICGDRGLSTEDKSRTRNDEVYSPNSAEQTKQEDSADGDRKKTKK